MELPDARGACYGIVALEWHGYQYIWNKPDTCHFIWLVHINDYRKHGLHTKIYDLHVIGVITWCLHLLHNCKLLDVCTICATAIYNIGTIVLLIALDFSFTPS